MAGLMRSWQDRVKNQGRVIAVLPGEDSPAASPAALQASAPPAAPVELPQVPGALAGEQLTALVAAALDTDLATLKNISSVERKVEHKREYLIPRYREYVERLLDTGHSLLAFWLVWLFDAGLVQEALAYAPRFFASGQVLPERFKATPRLFTATQFLEWANAEFAAGRSFEPYFSELFEQILFDPAVWNLPDETLGGFYRLRGLVAQKDGNLDGAACDLERALQLGQQVKTALSKVQKAIKQREAENSGV